MEKLKGCPWCGKKPKFLSSEKSYGYMKCTNIYCSSVTPDDEQVRKQATETWNKRIKD